MSARIPEVGAPVTPLVVTPDPVQLFCYSALTWNPHRIHYDAPYVTEEEGYDGVIVHGPFLGGMLLRCVSEWCAEWGTVTGTTYRSTAPAYVGDTLTCAGEVTAADGDRVEVAITISRPDGSAPCSGTATIRV